MSQPTYPPAPGRHHLGATENTAPVNGYRPGAPAEAQSGTRTAAAYDQPGGPGTWWDTPRPQPGEQPPAHTRQPEPRQPDQRQADPRQPDPAPAWTPPHQGVAGLVAGQHSYAAPPPIWEPATPPTPAPAAPASQPATGVDSHQRGLIVERMIQINTSHARQAADRLGTKLAIGPHCLALFSVDLGSGRFPRLSTATRLILDGEDAESLPQLLHDLAQRAHEQITAAHEAGTSWDFRTPLTGLVLRSDEVTPTTTYVGLGISTLDTPEIAWSHAKHSVTAADGLHLRGQGLIYLGDGTAVHVIRRAQMASGQHDIVANRRVDSQYPSRRDEHLVERATQMGDPTWGLLRRLHEVLSAA